jgi:hypothetical protein
VRLDDTNIPPHGPEPVNQLTVVPLPPTTESVVGIPSQIGLAVALIAVGATGKGLTVTVTEAQAEGLQGVLSERTKY